MNTEKFIEENRRTLNQLLRAIAGRRMTRDDDAEGLVSEISELLHALWGEKDDDVDPQVLQLFLDLDRIFHESFNKMSDEPQHEAA